MSKEIQAAIETLNAVEATTKKNAKLELLKKQQSNEILKEMFMYTFNPFWTYNIKKIEKLDLETESNSKLDITYKNFTAQLRLLRDRIETGNKAVENMKLIIELAPVELRKWLVRILFRELQAGVQIDTVNKAFGNYIPQYNVLLASKDLKKVYFPCYIEPKSDGMRCGIYVYDDGTVEMRTRNGKVFSGFDDLEEEALKVFVPGFMYDGELLGIDGSFKGMQKLAMKIATGKEAIFSLYDRVPIAFMKDDSRFEYKMDFSRRRMRLEKLGLSYDEGIIRLGETYEINDMTEAEKMYEGFVERGFEGAMFKMKDMYYEKNTASKRSKKMIKLKPEETMDLEILDVIEERDVNGNPKGTLGAFVISYKGFTVNVGSGLKDKFKDEVWAEPKKYIGKIAEIKTDGETSNEKGGLSLRFPRFITMRFDKDVADF